MLYPCVLRMLMHAGTVFPKQGGYHGHNDIALMSLTPDELRPFPTPHSGSLGISKAVEEVRAYHGRFAVAIPYVFLL